MTVSKPSGMQGLHLPESPNKARRSVLDDLTRQSSYTAADLTFPSGRTAIEDSKGWAPTLRSWQELWPFDLWSFDRVLDV